MKQCYHLTIWSVEKNTENRNQKVEKTKKEE